MHRAVALVALTAGLAVAACGGPTAVRQPEPVAGADLSPALAPIGWLIGDWQSTGDQHHWVATAGVLYGVGFHADGSYELMIIDDAEQGAEGKPDGTLRLYPMPNGALPTVFTGARDAAKQVRFTSSSADGPTTISYELASPGLVATVNDGTGGHALGMIATPAVPAPEAEAADRAFAKATDADGVDGWLRSFAADGAMLRKDKRIEGPDAIRAAMAPLLGSASLLWEPLWSRPSPDGTLAVTVGRARIVEHAAVVWRGSYLTLWRHDPDGWKVLVDVGRDENPL